ncbi:MAG: hypothetical protein C0611_08275 [Desulfobacteraceae bacterium]|nr:MAG: hypothetical protein C0611_08275 [Desulfobacteraceae bacterium]
MFFDPQPSLFQQLTLAYAQVPRVAKTAAKYLIGWAMSTEKIEYFHVHFILSARSVLNHESIDNYISNSPERKGGGHILERRNEFVFMIRIDLIRKINRKIFLLFFLNIFNNSVVH